MHSPLSPATANTKRARALLLQFILREILDAQQGTLQYVPRSYFYPSDWSHEVGCLNRLEEHLQLLTHAFPELSKESRALEKILDILIRSQDPKHLKKLYTALLPFINASKDNENLLFFLLKHQRALSELSSLKNLKSLIPKNAEQRLVDAFSARGFKARAQESKDLLKTLHE